MLQAPRRALAPMSLWAGLAAGVLLAACGPEAPTRGPVPRRPAGPAGEAAKPPPRPQFGTVGPNRVASKPGVDITRGRMTDLIMPYTDEDEAIAFRLCDRARDELNDGTTTQAFELLDAAVDKSPDSVPPYVIRAQALLAEGSLERARADLRTAVDLEPNAPWLAEIVAVSGAIYETEGNQDAAIKSYRRALQISAANVTARDALRRLASP